MKNIAPIEALIACVFVLLAMSSPEAERAVVIHDSGCQVLMSNGKVGALTANHDLRVYTSGPKMRMCQGRISNPTGRAIHLDARNTGMMCEVDGTPTNNWKETISASGHVSLICRIR